jgi:hypothetical protein
MGIGVSRCSAATLKREAGVSVMTCPWRGYENHRTAGRLHTYLPCLAYVDLVDRQHSIVGHAPKVADGAKIRTEYQTILEKILDVPFPLQNSLGLPPE